MTTTPHTQFDRAMAAAETVAARLSEERQALDKNRGRGVRTPVALVRSLMVRLVPEVCAGLAASLHGLPAPVTARVLDWLIAHTPYGEPRLESLAVLLRAHLVAYANSLSRWDGWQPVDLYQDTDSEPLVQAWFRPEDHWVAADFVGLVYDPKNFERPSREYAQREAPAPPAHPPGPTTEHRGWRPLLLACERRPPRCAPVASGRGRRA